MPSMIIPLPRFAPLMAACAAAALCTSAAVASETRGFVVSWFYYANMSTESDCPHGINPTSEVTYRRILKDRGASPSETEKLMSDFPNSARAELPNRGRLDGKPANAYLLPTTTKDPMLYLGEGRTGIGFNLDGKDGPKNFVDPETGEKGVDNQLYRVIGCADQLRSAAGRLPTFPEMQWDVIRDHTPAWLVEVGGIDNLQNDDDVVVTIVRATMPITRNAQSQPQRDMTYTPAPIPRTDGNVVHGKIKNGLLTTDSFNFFMVGELFAQFEYAIRDARIRIKFNSDGTMRGVVGGYQDWRTLYASWAIGGVGFESMIGFDIPGMYYALKKSADAYPDPKTGENAYISSAYIIDAIPAFIVHPRAQDPRPSSGRKVPLPISAPLATPPGITIKSVPAGTTQSDTAPRQLLSLADAKGQTLYVYDKDGPSASTCVENCAAERAPAAAPTGAIPVGEWSIVARSDGARQWAYRGRPLYTYAKEVEVGPPAGTSAEWHVFELRPQQWMQLPSGIEVGDVPAAAGQALTDLHGKTLYAFNGKTADGKISNAAWTPVRAPQSALPKGDFTIVSREDGIFQWASNGRPLYTSALDIEPGDSNGVGADPRFEVALAIRYFIPPEVMIQPDQRRNGLMVTADTAQALYAREPITSYGPEGAYNARGGGSSHSRMASRNSLGMTPGKDPGPAKGQFGLGGCDEQCAQTWRPLKAPAAAQPQGYWSVFTRPDGTRQWAYQGYALYTYAEDKPGQATGYDIYNRALSDTKLNPQAWNLGYYWRLVSP